MSKKELPNNVHPPYDNIIYSSSFPEKEHYAIIVFSEYYDGDNDTDMSKCEYLYFKDENSWKEDIQKRIINGEKEFVPIRAKKAKVSIETKVTVE